MELWIYATLAAAGFQTVRFMLQKTLSTGQLSASGATFARFIYSAPFVLAGLAIWFWATDTRWPGLTPAFWGYALLGGMSQILATVCVVLTFRERNFAVGITFKKTEVIQTALFGLVILSEGVSLAGLSAICIGFVAVLLLAKPPEGQAGWANLVSRGPALGLASGVLFAISATSYRGASLEIEAEPALRAAITLGAVVTIQSLAMIPWLWRREPGEMRAVWKARRVAVWVGLTSLGGSFGWFLAFTLQNAAYVKALGQVEMALSLLASVLFFKERITAREVAGMGFMVMSLLVLLLAI